MLSEVNTTGSPLENEIVNIDKEYYLANNLNNEEDILYQKDAELDAEFSAGENYTDIYKLQFYNATESGGGGGGGGSTTQAPRLEQKLTEISTQARATAPIATERPCPLECGAGGGCVLRDAEEPVCLCPLGRGGLRCEKGQDTTLLCIPSAIPSVYPRDTGKNSRRLICMMAGCFRPDGFERASNFADAALTYQSRKSKQYHIASKRNICLGQVSSILTKRLNHILIFFSEKIRKN